MKKSPTPAPKRRLSLSNNFLLVMIPKDKEYRLIKIYMYICDMYEQSLKYHCQRYSNNSIPLFSDEEILTIYFFVGHEQKYTLIKDIHNFAKEYLREWFPKLVSYQTFN